MTSDKYSLHFLQMFAWSECLNTSIGSKRSLNFSGIIQEKLKQGAERGATALDAPSAPKVNRALGTK